MVYQFLPYLDADLAAKPKVAPVIASLYRPPHHYSSHYCHSRGCGNPAPSARAYPFAPWIPVFAGGDMLRGLPFSTFRQLPGVARVGPPEQIVRPGHES